MLLLLLLLLSYQPKIFGLHVLHIFPKGVVLIKK